MKANTVSGGALWVGGLLALLTACFLRHPLLLPWRGMATALLLILSWGGGLVFIRRWRSATEHRLHRGLLCALWLLVGVMVVAQEAQFYGRKHAVLTSGAAEAQTLGAHFIIGYHPGSEIELLVEKGLVGGLFVDASSMKGQTREQIAAEIANLQKIRKQAGLPALMVSTDQEGGIVSRMSPPLTLQPALAEKLAGVKQADIQAIAFEYGRAQGRELASLGVNVNLAPVADLSFPHERQKLDLHSLISQRAIDADPHRVSAAVIGYAQGLESQGLRATFKHFPGLGRVAADTHLFSASLSASLDTLEASDWVPFQEGLRSTQSLLMVGHASLSAVDDDIPASLSGRVVQGIVRDRWGHQGVLVTDSMTMAPVLRYGLCRAGTDALNAGIDLLLVSYDTDQYYTVMHCLMQARLDGRLDEGQLRKSALRLRRLFHEEANAR